MRLSPYVKTRCAMFEEVLDFLQFLFVLLKWHLSRAKTFDFEDVFLIGLISSSASIIFYFNGVIQFYLM